MKAISKDPGSASAEELATYWRLPSARAARELARKIGVRNVGGRYRGARAASTIALGRTEAATLHGGRRRRHPGGVAALRQATRLGEARCELSRPYPATEKADALAKGTAARLAGRIACASLQARLDDSNDLA